MGLLIKLFKKMKTLKNPISWCFLLQTFVISKKNVHMGLWYFRQWGVQNLAERTTIDLTTTVVSDEIYLSMRYCWKKSTLWFWNAMKLKYDKINTTWHFLAKWANRILVEGKKQTFFTLKIFPNHQTSRYKVDKDFKAEVWISRSVFSTALLLISDFCRGFSYRRGKTLRIFNSNSVLNVKSCRWICSL